MPQTAAPKDEELDRIQALIDARNVKLNSPAPPPSGQNGSPLGDTLNEAYTNYIKPAASIPWNLIEGAAKGALSTVEGGGTALRKAFPSLNSLPSLELPINTQPSNTSQTIGKGIEQVAEYAMPFPGSTASLPGRMASSAAKFGLIGAAHSGGDVETIKEQAATGALMPAAEAMLSSAVAKFGESVKNTRAYKLYETITGMMGGKVPEPAEPPVSTTSPVSAPAAAPKPASSPSTRPLPPRPSTPQGITARVTGIPARESPLGRSPQLSAPQPKGLLNAAPEGPIEAPGTQGRAALNPIRSVTLPNGETYTPSSQEIEHGFLYRAQKGTKGFVKLPIQDMTPGETVGPTSPPKGKP